jgi:hypothetical protein
VFNAVGRPKDVPEKAGRTSFSRRRQEIGRDHASRADYYFVQVSACQRAEIDRWRAAYGGDNDVSGPKPKA